MKIIQDKYEIDKNQLTPYQIDLRELITNNDDFNNQFKSVEPIIFSENSRIQFLTFQQNFNHLFNDIIIQINDAE